MKPLFTEKSAAKPDAPDILAAALEHLAAGRSVIAVCAPVVGGDGCLMSGKNHGASCPGPGKTPLMPWKRFQTERATEDEVRGWFRRWPRMNIGMATGAVSGTIVLDADSPSAVNDALAAGEGELTSAPMVRTSKGAHWYIAHPGEPVRNFARKRPGLDFRGDGGYVLIPPSLHKSGTRYEWHATPEDMGGLPEAPSWLMELLKKKTPDRERTSSDEESDGPLDYGQFVDGVGEGARNDRLWSLVCSMRAKGIDIELAKLAAVGAFQQCNPPYDEADPIEMVERAYEAYPAPEAGARLGDDWDDDDEEVAEAEGAEHVEGPDDYPIASLGELLTKSDLVDDRWLVEGLIPNGSLVWLYAGPGTGKNMFAFQMALHVANGDPLDDREVKGGPVLFFCEDMSVASALEYLELLARGNGLDPDCAFFLNRKQGLQLTSDAGRALAWQKIQEVNPVLVILDACESLVPSNDYTTKELQHLRKLVSDCRNADITVIVIDHTNKSGSGSRGGKNAVDQLYGGRAKSAAADVMIRLTGDLKGSGVRAEWTKVRGAAIPPHEISLRETEDGLRLTIVSTITKAKTPSEKKIVQYLTGVSGEERAKREIARATKLSERQVGRSAGVLFGNGVIKRRYQPMPSGAREAYFWIPCHDDDVVGIADNDAA